MKTTVKTGATNHVQVDRIGPNLVGLEINNFGLYECAYLDKSAAHVLGHALIRLAEQIEAEQAERAAA
jgi:hypothetical protein